MNKNLRTFIFLLAIITTSCNKDAAIKRQLNSKNIDDIIMGAYEAGESGDKAYVPLLLHNAANPAFGSDVRFKDYSVYREKMSALQKILHVKPPHNYQGIEIAPDSTNVKFYTQYWENLNKGK